MRMILPKAGDELDDFELAEAYAYPRERWLRTNMVMSADGAGSLNGLSGGLSAAGDKRVFGILRVLADVVLVGSGTAEAESYSPARPRPALASLRAGRPATATIAVISGSLDLDLDSPLFTEAPADARTIVITREAARPELRTAAAKAADVIPRIGCSAPLSLPVIGGTLDTRIAAWRCLLVSAGQRAGRGTAAAGWLGSSARRGR
jgi:riboflavin biosynthesis pyrimidine reductase